MRLLTIEWISETIFSIYPATPAGARNLSNDNSADEKTVIYTGSASPAARLVCLDTLLDESLKSLDIRVGVQDETIGRSDDNSISIKYNKMSRNHARVSFENGKWILEDLNSANGIYINEQRITRAAMGQGDIVVIGQVPFRFEIENTGPGMAPEPPPPADKDYVGDSGTMYAQHVGVIESLASPDDQPEPGLEDLPPPPSANGAEPPRAAPSAAPEKRRGGMGKTVAMLVVLIGLVGGYFYWQSVSEDKQSEALYSTYKKETRRFLEQVEGASSTEPRQALESEIAAVDTIAARVDVALQQAKHHTGLSQLKQQLLFLVFERRLALLLQRGDFYDAESLIPKTRAAIDAVKLEQGAPLYDYGSLLDLSETAVQFKHFSAQYPTPGPDSTARPDDYALRKMLETKGRFIALKKQNYQDLSVVYARLHQLLEKVEEQDIRLLNRWQEISKRSRT